MRCARKGPGGLLDEMIASAARFGGPSWRRYLRTMFGARPSSRATTLIFSPSRRQRRRMVSQVSMVITPWDAPLGGCLVSLPSPSRGSSCFMRSGVQFSGAVWGSNLRPRFQKYVPSIIVPDAPRPQDGLETTLTLSRDPGELLVLVGLPPSSYPNLAKDASAP